MCGFVGCFDLNSGSAPIAEGLKEELRSQVIKMSKKIRHRGPDWSGVYTGNNAIRGRPAASSTLSWRTAPLSSPGIPAVTFSRQSLNS